MKYIILGSIFCAVIWFVFIDIEKSEKNQNEQSIKQMYALAGSWVHDFGTVKISDPVDLEHAFTLTNVSDGSVTIMDVSTTCGCTKASADKKIITPGESVKVTASLLLSDSGPKQAQVVLLTDAGEGETLRLTLSATGQRQRKLFSNIQHVSLAEGQAKRMNIYVIDYTTDQPPVLPTMEYPEGMRVTFYEWMKISERRESVGLPARWEGRLEIESDKEANPALNKRQEITVNLTGYQSLLFTATIIPESSSG